MKLKSDLFPYPVLSSESDDFSTGTFNVDITQKVLSATKIQLGFDFHLENDVLSHLVKKDKARFVVHIEGQSSVYRKLIYLTKGETYKELEIDAKDAPKKLFANFMIIANDKISNYKNDGFNPEFYGTDLSIPIIQKSSILAFDSMAELNIDFSNFERTDIRSMIRVASKKQKHMEIDTDGDRIQINLPEKSYSAYFNLSNSSQIKQKLLLATIILPALTTVIQRIIHGEIDGEEREWYESLSILLKKIGYDIQELIGSEHDPMYVAQQLLDFPLDDALYNFYLLEEGDE